MESSKCFLLQEIHIWVVMILIRLDLLFFVAKVHYTSVDLVPSELTV